MKDGQMILKHTPIFTFEHPTEGIEIQSNHPEVYSVSSGKVVRIIDLPDGKLVVLVRDCVLREEDHYYVYGNLKSTEVQKGDWVELNQPLGLASEEEGKFAIFFQYRKESEKIIPSTILNCQPRNIYY